MACNFPISSPIITKIFTQVFGIPALQSGRTVAGETFEISGIVLHCYPGTIAQLDNELKCAVIKGITTPSTENSYHYGIGVNNSIRRYVEDADISWTFGAYKSNVYSTVPPPTEDIDWPVLQAIYPGNVTPDVYVLNIAMALGEQIGAGDCPECLTSSGLPEPQHEQLVQLLAYLAEQYTIPITTDYITFHDFICCNETENKCPCTELDNLLTEVIEYCPPCPNGSEAQSYPEADETDTITHLIGVIEPCCEESNGCVVEVPFDNCFFGELVQPGDIDAADRFVGLELNEVTGQLCLVNDNIDVAMPLTGDGIDASPFTVDRCTLETWLDSFAPLDQVERIMGVDSTGCWTLEDNDTWFDRIVCAQPETPGSTPTWVLAKGDVCPEWVTPAQVIDSGISVLDTDCIDLTWTGNTLSADPIIAPTQAGVPNVLSCIPGQGLFAPLRLSIASDCISVTDNGDGTYSIDLIVASAQSGVNNVFDCIAGQGAFSPEYSFVDGNTVDFTASGVFNSSITAEVILDPDPTNILTSGASGLLAPPLNVDNVGSACIDLTIDTSTNTLSADLIISPDADNIIECRANGSYVGFATLNTDCISLSFVGGVLSATPNISGPLGGIANATICDPGNGLYTPRGANTLVNGPLTGNGSDLSPLDIDFTALDAGDLCDLGGVIPPGTLIEIVGRDGAGCLRYESVADVISSEISVTNTDCISMAFVGNVISAAPILSAPQGGFANAITCTALGLFVPKGADLGSLNTDCIDIDLTNGVITATIVIDPLGTNQISCSGSGLVVPLGAGITVDDTDCIDMTLTAGVITADPVIAPAQATVDNALTCIPGQGLYVPITAGGVSVADTDCIDMDLTATVITANPIIAPTQLSIDNLLSCIPVEGMFVPETQVTLVGPTPAGGNEIGIDTNGDGADDYTFAEGFDTISTTGDCVDGGIGNDYALKAFSMAGTTLTVESAPEHTSVAASIDAAQTDFSPAPASIGTQTGQSPINLIVNNPSICRDMVVQIVVNGYNGRFSFETAPATPLTLAYAIQPVILIDTVTVNNPAGWDIVVKCQVLAAEIFAIDAASSGYTAIRTLSPGGSVDVDVSANMKTDVVHNATISTNIQINAGGISIMGSTV